MQPAAVQDLDAALIKGQDHPVTSLWILHVKSGSLAIKTNLQRGCYIVILQLLPTSCKTFDLFPLCLFVPWDKCHSSLWCPLAEHQWSTVLNVPLLLSASLDNIWLGDLWDATFCCCLCECVKECLLSPFIRLPLVMHACSRLVKHPTWDLTFAHLHTPLLPSGPSASLPLEPADETEY